jgi:hypothetical protein
MGRFLDVSAAHRTLGEGGDSVNSNELIRRYKHQRRRNARTIRERNETIRRLEWKVKVYREVAEDQRFIIEVLHELAGSLLSEREREEAPDVGG